jgi:hypothetical protein
MIDNLILPSRLTLVLALKEQVIDTKLTEIQHGNHCNKIYNIKHPNKNKIGNMAGLINCKIYKFVTARDLF